jgi:hypothetical protein
VPVWRCSKSAERVFSVHEVLALMRDANPKWFEAPAAAPPAAEPGPNAPAPPDDGGDGNCC